MADMDNSTEKMDSDIDLSVSDEEFFCGKLALTTSEIRSKIENINLKIRKIVSMDAWTRHMQTPDERRMRNRLRMRLWRRRKKLQEELDLALGRGVDQIICDRNRRRMMARVRSKKYRERKKAEFSDTMPLGDVENVVDDDDDLVEHILPPELSQPPPVAAKHHTSNRVSKPKVIGSLLNHNTQKIEDLTTPSSQHKDRKMDMLIRSEL